MTEKTLTLQNMLGDGAPSLELGAVTAAVTAATAALPGAAAQQIASTFQQTLDGLFQLGLGDVLSASWGKAAALRDALLATREDPELAAIVPLLDHKITSKHRPHIDVMYGGKRLVQVSLDITLNFALKGVVLEIRNGEIAGVKAGICTGDGAVAFLDQTLIKKQSPELPLPGKLAFTKKKPVEAAQ